MKKEKEKNNYWVIKFAPFRTSWEEIVQRGVFTLRGVRNPEARNNLNKMKLHDLVFFYHSQKGRAIVGLLEVVHEAYPDPTTTDKKWVTCNFAPIRSLKVPVKLSYIRANPILVKTPLIRQPRLAVLPLSKKEFEQIKILEEEIAIVEGRG